MPIRVRQFPEPFAPDARREAPVLARSDAYRNLFAALRRYLDGEINGRSFLISGHRGSGKTTLVLHAVWELQKEARPSSLRPLLVRLQGPDLLPDPEVLRAAAEGLSGNGDEAGGGEDQPESGGDDDGKKKKEREPEKGQEKRVGAREAGGPQAMAERALRQITEAVYRALCETMADAYGRWIEHVRYLDADRPFLERAELGARFRLALDGAPSPAELRELYRLGGFLDSGLLLAAFELEPEVIARESDRAWEREHARVLEEQSHDTFPGSMFGRHLREGARRRQGMRELTALATASSAFRVVAGEVQSTRKETRSAEEERSRTWSLDPSLKELAQQGMVLALGGAVGAGTLAAGEGGWLAALVAVVTVLAGAAAVKLSGSRTTKRAASEDYTFLRKHDASTLERELPVLIQRLRDAGLAPVFVVDELDKVDGLQRHMRTVVSQLKQFVSERAFFCFLTDRDYFEHLRDRSLREPYPHEHTFFTDRLFILFRPADLHRYLGEVLRIEGTSPDDEIHQELLIFSLLHRSKMHPVDLHRELRRTGPGGRAVTLPAAASEGHGSGAEETLAFDLGLQLSVTVQLAVELLLDRQPLRGRLEQDPHFAQPVYDALYYLSRTWEEGGGEEGDGILDLSPEAFHDYLRARMNPNRPSVLGRDGDGGSDGDASRNQETDDRLPLSPRDEAFLLEQVERLVELLADPEGLRIALDEEPLSYTEASYARDAIPLDDVLLEPLGEGRYAFRVDPYGRPLTLPEAAAEAPEAADDAAMAVSRVAPKAVPTDGDALEPPAETELPPRDEVGDWIALVSELDDFLFELVGMGLGTLANLRVLSAVPTWSQVGEAVQHLQAYADGAELEPDTGRHVETLRSYVERLDRRNRVLVASLYFGIDLGRAALTGEDLERRTLGLVTLAEGLEFGKHRTVEALWKELTRYGKTYETKVVLSIPDVPPVPGGKRWKDRVVGIVSGIGEPLDEVEQAAAARRAWDTWKGRLERRVVMGRAKVEVTVDDLRCHVMGIPPAGVLKLDLDAMTLADWTFAFLAGAEPEEHLGESEERPWLMVGALTELGLGEALQAFAESVPDQLAHFEEAASWVRRMASARPRALEARPCAIVLHQLVDSRVEDWRTSQRYGGLSVPMVEDPTLLSQMKLIFQTAHRPIVLVEPPIPASLQDTINALDQRGLSRFELLSKPTSGDAPAVVGAESLDEAMEQALKLLDLPT